MKVVKTEIHTVNSEFTYDIPDDHIANRFGSVERFKEIVSHNGDGWNEPIGEPPTDEESDLFMEFLEEYDYDRYDDWVSDRKGGYDVTFNVEDEGEWDSDEETLN
jgi:hypothetical protein